jgi:hypothetical protein
MNIITNAGMTKKDIFNARNASLNVKDYIDEPLNITGCAVAEDNGKTVGYIVAKDIGVFGFTSDTIIKSLDELAEFIEEGETIVRVKANESKSGKTYYTLVID